MKGAHAERDLSLVRQLSKEVNSPLVLLGLAHVDGLAKEGVVEVSFHGRTVAIEDSVEAVLPIPGRVLQMSAAVFNKLVRTLLRVLIAEQVESPPPVECPIDEDGCLFVWLETQLAILSRSIKIPLVLKARFMSI